MSVFMINNEVTEGCCGIREGKVKTGREMSLEPRIYQVQAMLFHAIVATVMRSSRPSKVVIMGAVQNQ